VGIVGLTPLRDRRAQDQRTRPVLLRDGGRPDGQLEIPPAPGLKVCNFCHGERRRKACKEVAVVLAIGHTLRAQEALSRPDALPGFLEVVHRLVKDGVFVGHGQSIRVGILRRVGGPGL
jgi:hypothetical protein